MPKSLFQEIVFTIIMVFFMVYALVCYNISLATGGMSNAVFLGAFRELPIMAPIAFVLDMLVAGPLAKRFTFRIFDPKSDKPLFIILSISVFSVIFMCPIMSLCATLIFKGGFQREAAAVWLQTTAMNFPMAFFWQLCFAGPIVRRIFSLVFRNR